MASAPFSIYRRKSRDRASGRSVVRFCARFIDQETGKILKTKTLKATSRTAAVLEARALLDRGGDRASDPLVLALAREYWGPDSPAAALRSQRGRPYAVSYMRQSAYIIEKHLAETFEGVRFSALNLARVERWMVSAAMGGLSPKSINATLSALRAPVSSFARREGIPDPLRGLEGVAEAPKERGTLSIEEVARIVRLEGEDPRVKAAVLLGALCGLRLGEARGLRHEDVDREAGLLHIRHNWQRLEGMKLPKRGSARDVPLPEAVRVALDLCEEAAPRGGAFILWNQRRSDRPCDIGLLGSGFRRVLATIGIDEAERRERNLVFHGLRHFFVSASRATGLPDYVVMRLAGHRSMGMTDGYTHHERMIDFGEARRSLDEAIRKAPSSRAAGGKA